MNRKSKFILSALLAFCVAGTGVAVAMAATGAEKNVTDNGIDSAVYLDWGENEVTDIADLTDTAPAYRKVVCKAPNGSASATDKGKFSFALTADEGKSLEGVAVSVATSEWKVDTPAGDILCTDQTTWTSGEIAAQTTYYLKVTVTSEAYAKYVAGTITMSGVMTLSYKFAE